MISISLLTFTANVATCVRDIRTYQHDQKNQEVPRMAHYSKYVERKADEPLLIELQAPIVFLLIKVENNDIMNISVNVVFVLLIKCVK